MNITENTMSLLNYFTFFKTASITTRQKQPNTVNNMPGRTLKNGKISYVKNNLEIR